MELIEHTKIWVNGEVFQGKIMMAMGIALLIAWIAIFRSEHTILKGTIIPGALMLVVFLGYGGMQTFFRPTHVDKVVKLHTESPEKALDQEIKKAVKDEKAYRTLKPIWAGLIVLSVILYFVFPTDYLKGLSLGLIALFFTLVMLDTVLHYRLEVYHEALKGL